MIYSFTLAILGGYFFAESQEKKSRLFLFFAIFFGLCSLFVGTALNDIQEAEARTDKYYQETCKRFTLEERKEDRMCKWYINK